MLKEKAKVHYLSNNKIVVRNKDVLSMTYNDFNIHILDEDKLDYPELLYKDQNGEYWLFYYGAISFERFNSLIEGTVSGYDKDRCINYCDYILEKVKPMFKDIKSNMKNKIDNRKYFNLVELSYLENNYSDLYSEALKSREEFLLRKKEEKEKQEQEENNRREQKVKEKNQVFRDKVINTKIAISSGKEVLSEVLNFYKDDNYNNETYQNNFLYLLKEYGIEVPLKTQGYINNTLHSFNFENGSYRIYGKNSSKCLTDYLFKLKEKITEELKKDIVMDNELDITDSM